MGRTAPRRIWRTVLSEFEFMRSVTIGQYLPTGSLLHRLDPRAKLLMVSLLLAGVVLAGSILGLTLALALVLAGIALGRIPFSFALRGLGPAMPFLLFLAALQVLAIPQNDVGTVLWQWWRVELTLADLRAAVVLLLRFTVLILGLSLFSFSTTTSELARGVEQLLRPGQRLGLPVHEFSLMVVIALRFVPLLALEAEHIAKAQASRGADLGGGRMNAFRRTIRMLPLLVPLFIAALRRAETLILAMEARCYTGGKGRTHLTRLKSSPKDGLAVALVLGLTISLLAMAWFHVDQAIWAWIFG
jgi:energy-coupling factor transport system permease protein